jgi:hypothetical protein
MAMNPYQGDDIDPFSGARDEKTGATNTRPTYQASTADQMDERDRREMEMTKESKGALKKAKAPIVTKEQLKASGFDNLRDYMNAQKGLKRRDGKTPSKVAPPKPETPPASDKKGMTISEAGRAKMSMKDKLNAIRTGSRNPNKTTGAPAEDMGAKSTRSLGDIFSAAAKNRAKRIEDDVDSSMPTGMKKGGKIAGYKKGGKIDGCAQRGKTKGRMI